MIRNRIKGKTIIISAVILIASSLCNLAGAQTDTSLTLEKCRELALQYNKKVKMAEADATASDYLVKSAQTKYLPRVDFVGGWINPGDRELQPFAIDLNMPGITPPGLSLPLDFLGIAPTNIYTGGFVMRQPIFMGFKITEANKMARSASAIAHEEVKLKEADILANVDKAYWKVISVQEKVNLSKTYITLLDRLVEDLENIYNEGMITRNEVLKVKVKQNEVALNLLKAENGLELAKMALGQIIGMDAEDICLSSKAINEKELTDRLVLSALGNNGAERSEIAMLRSKLAITESAKNIVKSQFLPNVLLTAGYNWIKPNIYKGSQSNLGGDWYIGVGVQLPIFTWGDRLHQVNIAEQKVRKAELELQDAQEMIDIQVRQNEFKCTEALRKIELAKLSKSQAEENLRITRNSLLEGMNNTRDILEAQVMWEKASSEEIDARVEAATALSELEKSTGALYKYAEEKKITDK